MNQIMTKLLACLQPVWLMLISFLHWPVTMLPSVHSYISEYSVMITYRNESQIFNNATQFVIILVTDSLMNAMVSKGQCRGFDPTEQVSEVCLESQSETSSWFMQLCLWLHFPPTVQYHLHSVKSASSAVKTPSHDCYHRMQFSWSWFLFVCLFFI